AAADVRRRGSSRRARGMDAGSSAAPRPRGRRSVAAAQRGSRAPRERAPDRWAGEGQTRSCSLLVFCRGAHGIMSKTTIKPALHHVTLQTTHLDEMIERYSTRELNEKAMAGGYAPEIAPVELPEAS